MKYLFIALFIILISSTGSIIYLSKPLPKPEIYHVGHGRASKIEFSGHSYIVWQQNLSDCIIHDPDCKCQNPLKSTKLVDGPRGVMPPEPPKGANGPVQFEVNDGR